VAYTVGSFEEVICTGFVVVAAEMGYVFPVDLRRSVIERSSKFLECY
jgi:hypothetical protein